MRTARRFLALTPGNPMNPVTLLVLAFFGIVIVGFPPLMFALGLGTGGVVAVMLVVVVTAVLLIGLMVMLGRRYAGDLLRLCNGGAWVHWHLTPSDRERFVSDERVRSQGEARRYLLYSAVVACVGALFMWSYTETIRGGLIGFAVLGAAGLLVVATTYLWGGARPRFDADDIGETYLGDLGIYQMGRYTPVRGFNIFLTQADLLAGEPPVLRFTVGSRNRYGSVSTNDVRVAIPAGRESEAEELVARFQREFQLQG